MKSITLMILLTADNSPKLLIQQLIVPAMQDVKTFVWNLYDMRLLNSKKFTRNKKIISCTGWLGLGSQVTVNLNRWIKLKTSATSHVKTIPDINNHASMKNAQLHEHATLKQQTVLHNSSPFLQKRPYLRMF